MTLPSVVVHCNGIFQAGQLSVAIGRAVSSRGLSLIGYRKGLCLKPKPVIQVFYGSPSSLFSDDLSCCRNLDILTHNSNPDLENIGSESDSDSSEFNEEEMNEIDNVIQDYHSNIKIAEHLHIIEELPYYINVEKLKMHCFVKTPVTQTHEKINEICTSIDLNRLRYFCHTQLNRIKEISSELTIQNKCTPKQWTSVLGANHIYCETLDFSTNVKGLFCITGDIPKENKLVASTIIMEIMKAEIHNRCDVQSADLQTTGFSADVNSDAGKAKVRYVAGMCVSKLKNHYMNVVISNQNNPDKTVQKNVKSSREKVEVLKHMVGDETLDYEHDKTLQEVERRQNVRRGLTHVNELTFQFFLNLLSKICGTLNTNNFRQKGSEIFEWTFSLIVNDEDLQMLFSEISTCENYEIKTSVFKEIVHKFLMVSHKQFLKDSKDRLNVIKKKAHREEIGRKAEKRKSISMKDIPRETSEERETAHMKLKLNCLGNNNYLCGRDFTKVRLMELCAAYGLDCNSAMKKQEIAKRLSDQILKSDRMLNAETCISEYLPLASSSQTGGAAKRQKKSGKGKGRGKGKKNAEATYNCKVCKEEYIEGEEWIECDECKSWLHRTCDDIMDEEWEELQEGEEIPWSCSQCSLE